MANYLPSKQETYFIISLRLVTLCYTAFVKKKNSFLKGKTSEWGEIPIHSPRSTFRNSSNMNVELNYFEHIKDLAVSSKKAAKHFVRKVH